MAAGGRAGRLVQRDVVDGLADVEHDALPAGVGPIAHHPGRARITVDRHDRTVLGAVGERLAVRGRSCLHRALLDGDGGRCAGHTEDWEALVGRIGAQHIGYRRLVVLRESDDVLRAAPMVGAVAVRVGDDDGARRSGRPGDLVAVQRAAVAHELLPVEQAGGGGVDDAVTAADEDDGLVLGSDDADSLLDRHQLDGCDGRADPGVGSRLLVDHRDHGLVDDEVPVRRRRAESRYVPEQVGDELGSRSAEPVEGGVAAQPDRAGAEQAGDRGQRGRFDGAGLEPVVERVDEVHRRGAAEGEEVARDQRPGGQTGERWVDGVAPPEGAELLAGQLEHPAACGVLVEVGDGGRPRRGRVLVPIDRRIDEAVAGEHRQVGQRQQPDGGSGNRTPRHVALPRYRQRDRGGVDEQAGTDRQPQDEHRHGARARPQGERGAGRAIAEEDVHQRCGIADRVDADPEQDARDDERHGEPAVGPLRRHQPDEGHDEQHEPGRDEAPRHHVVAPRRRRRGVRVADVGEPVAEVAPHLRGRRREAHRLE